MQMSPTGEGDFTTKASVVDQISKRQDVCRSSFETTTLVIYLGKLRFKTTLVDVI